MDFEIVAHRGYSAIAPENTLAAFAAAMEGGANAIEFDVRLCADNVPILIHDATVNRTTDGTGNVRDLTLEQLKQLDAGLWFSDRFIGERIPTLAETLDFLQDTPASVCAEIKDGDDWSSEDIERLIETIRAPLRGSLRDRNWESRFRIASFSDEFVDRVAAIAPTLPRAYYPLTPADYQEKVRQLKSEKDTMLLCEYHLLLENPHLIKISRNCCIDVGAWTVDRAEDLEALVRLGVKQIVTNTLLNSKSNI
ncbi:glycerophosphodiester phosphodiesterase family protein [Oscillatoria sp. FACHB-1406]|uniref:glycerophosphodiester phosphodiesterase n=1 Tax=Oscillatoria sp. FACHB-1406 TaxID=2692846 RepID=UPI001684B267|nr:glycerophosphodiester phosphodiesterase family protein [Oscillatoria sp. FACHB-1406]MBD2578954.1 glycerophosphodiester phosphodiesterase [Oscillatoria sp. FACHB-1406]